MKIKFHSSLGVAALGILASVAHHSSAWALSCKAFYTVATGSAPPVLSFGVDCAPTKGVADSQTCTCSVGDVQESGQVPNLQVGCQTTEEVNRWGNAPAPQGSGPFDFVLNSCEKIH